MNSSKPEQEFETLVGEVKACVTCRRMCDSKRVLNRGCGPLSAKVLVIGEAPGRFGADSSQLPFHGDKAGHNFEALIHLAGLSRGMLFITNAVLCNPKNELGNNATPIDAEIRACSNFLRRQIDLVNPDIIVTLGAVALRAVGFVEPHNLMLRDAVRTSTPWYGRELVPLYHPGQRAMIHRSFANQSADYHFLAERIKRKGQKRRSVSGVTRPDVAEVATAILTRFGTLSYFSLHKLVYLAEYNATLKYGERLTSAYFVRQKDGPYCVDLHPQRMKNAGLSVDIKHDPTGRIVASTTHDLFVNNDEGHSNTRISEVVDDMSKRYAGLSDERLKTIVYLTKPMRKILKLEKAGSNQFNAAITFS